MHYVRERYEVGHYPMYEEDGYRLLLLSTNGRFALRLVSLLPSGRRLARCRGQSD
jgi:hypothetical protein